MSSECSRWKLQYWGKKRELWLKWTAKLLFLLLFACCKPSIEYNLCSPMVSMTTRPGNARALLLTSMFGKNMHFCSDLTLPPTSNTQSSSCFTEESVIELQFCENGAITGFYHEESANCLHSQTTEADWLQFASVNKRATCWSAERWWASYQQYYTEQFSTINQYFFTTVVFLAVWRRHLDP